MFFNDANTPSEFKGQVRPSMKANNARYGSAAAECDAEKLADHGVKMDAALPVAFTRELEERDPQVWEDLTKAMIASRFVRIQGLAQGLKRYTWRKFNRFGNAGIRRHLKDTRVNFSHIEAEEKSHDVLYATAGYEWSIDEQLSNSRLSFDYLSELRRTSSEMIARAFDALLLTGDTIEGRTGLFNDASVSVIDQSELTGTWDASTTFAQILDDVKIMYNTVYTALKDLDMDPAQAEGLMPNTLILPSSVWFHIFRRDDADANHMTLMEVVKKQIPEITNVFHSLTLNTADGAGTGKRVVLYNDNPLNVKAIIQTPYEEMPTEQHGFAFRTYAYGAAIGTIFHRPFTALYADVDVA